MKLVYVASHPIQYHAPLFRELAKRCDFEAWFGHRQSAAQQGAAGYGGGFDWDVDLLSGYASRWLVNVARLPSVERRDGIDTPDVGEWLERHSPDVVIAGGWNLRTYLQVARAGLKRGIRVFARSDSHRAARPSWQVGLRRVLMGGRLRQFAGVLAAGERSAEYAVALGMPRYRVRVVPHCIDNDRFHMVDPIAARAEVRASLGIDAGDRVALFVGRFALSKRPGDLIDACAMERSMVPVFVGSGALEAGLRARARDTAVNARFAGFRNQSELPQFYAAADVLVLPSGPAETWGLVVNEALACGTPAVVSDVIGSAPDLVRAGYAVRSYPAGDIAALARAIAVQATTREALRPEATALAESMSPERVAAKMLESVA